ncbi:MAG TPA: hypothetical protein VFA99_05575 [Acidobacteriaceae bacterium]|nr:hypothetical protein [Acidobacteriaceae bacterium]
MPTIVIGGHTRNIGKTSVVAGVFPGNVSLISAINCCRAGKVFRAH